MDILPSRRTPELQETPGTRIFFRTAEDHKMYTSSVKKLEDNDDQGVAPPSWFNDLEPDMRKALHFMCCPHFWGASTAAEQARLVSLAREARGVIDKLFEEINLKK